MQFRPTTITRCSGQNHVHISGKAWRDSEDAAIASGRDFERTYDIAQFTRDGFDDEDDGVTGWEKLAIARLISARKEAGAVTYVQTRNLWLNTLYKV